MTFYELCGMVRHCWRIALAIVLACTLGMGLYSLKGSAPVYKATATVVATDPSGKVTTAQLMATVEAIGITVERETSGDGRDYYGRGCYPYDEPVLYSHCCIGRCKGEYYRRKYRRPSDSRRGQGRLCGAGGRR